ncbi:MAG: glyoxylase-like metal-dependent hydrolase (beta-lactamase superfamily II) [Gammaproteobacteria bacterium]|jgi:glyoxylase-like metal-dependent hydrolase (beta-lactamase superfamily II)
MSDHEFDPVAGHPLQLARGLRLILAPNPSPMTYLGTNTYLLGNTSIAVIDPGPDDDDHLAAILAATHTGTISHIIVTHAHLDHSPLARRLSAHTGAPVHGYGPATAGRSTIMQRLADQGFAGGGEGIDSDFAPDVILSSGDCVSTDEWTLKALHTPGHIGNHLSLIWGDAIFTGDHVMGWASSLVSPPDGDLTDFMASCEKLAQIDARIYFPGHGAPVTIPSERIAWLVAHRRGREAQILDTLSPEGLTVDQITRAVYTDVKPALIAAAKRNVFAHLVDLQQRGLITACPDLQSDAIFAIEN